MPFEKGNQLASSNLSFNAALKRVIERKNLSRKEKRDVLEEMAEILIDKALEGSEPTINGIAEKLDGRPHQSLGVDANIKASVVIKASALDEQL